MATPPVVSALLLCGAAIWFGVWRDFGAFLISIPVLAVAGLGAVVVTGWASVRYPRRGDVRVAWVLIGLAPLGYLYSYQPAQEVRFLLWAPAHRALLAEASRRNGIVMGWDSWGMAGQDTSSYLVVDTQDRLGSTVRAGPWTAAVGQTCGFWEEQRVWPKFYIVTTYTDCPYDGVEPAN